MQSSVAAQNDLSRSPQGQSDWRAEVESMEELMMTMLKRLQNLAMLRPGNLNIEEGILFQQRALTCLSSATEHDDEKNWLDEIDWKAFGLRLVQKRDAAKMQQKELANLVGVTAQTIRNLEMAAKRPSRELLFRLLAVPELNLKISDITGEENKPTLIPTSWLAPQYDPQKLMTDMVATLNGSGDALEQTTAYLDSRSAIDFLTIASSREYLGIFSNSAPLKETAQKITPGLGRAVLEIFALGCGDARRETALAQFCAEQMAHPSHLRMYLLDISHTILMSGYNHAKTVLGSHAE